MAQLSYMKTGPTSLVIVMLFSITIANPLSKTFAPVPPLFLCRHDKCIYDFHHCMLLGNPIRVSLIPKESCWLTEVKPAHMLCTYAAFCFSFSHFILCKFTNSGDSDWGPNAQAVGASSLKDKDAKIAKLNSKRSKLGSVAYAIAICFKRQVWTRYSLMLSDGNLGCLYWGWGKALISSL